LIPFPVEIITAITIILVGVILTVYFSILKKNGWIGEASNYRCPNPECRKIFQVPMKVKDFSTGKDVGFACPDCGYDLGSLKSGKGLKETAVQNGPELKIKDSVSKPIEAGVSTVNCGVKEPQAPLAAHPAFESKKNPSLQESDQSLLEQKFDDAKKDRPACCKHYLGYLGVLLGRAETLDECFFCPMLIECGKRAWH
jgi:hypothetical protein